MGTALGVGVSFGSWAAGALVDRSGSHGGFAVVMAAGGAAVLTTVAALPTLRRATAAHLTCRALRPTTRGPADAAHALKSAPAGAAPSPYVTAAAPIPMPSWRSARRTGGPPEIRPTTPPTRSSPTPTATTATTSAVAPTVRPATG